MFSFLHKAFLEFEINYDLDKINPSFHNIMHTVGSVVTTVGLFLLGMSPVLSVALSFALWILWEIGDGFKPWYTEFNYSHDQPKWINWLRANFLYSNKLSLQDIFIWDLTGQLSAILVIMMF
jgi:hypothetical protein